MIVKPKSRLPSFETIDEVPLAFHPERKQDVDVHPLRGLLRFGPYSRGMPLCAPDPIRCAIICPKTGFQRLAGLVRDLRTQHQPRERQNYLLQYDGFSKIFGIGLDVPSQVADRRVQIISDEDVNEALRSTSPPQTLATKIHSAVRQLATIRSEFDVILLYLPDTLSAAFKTSGDDKTSEFDLHDSIKAVCSSLLLPVQVINDEALKYSCRCSVAWRLSIALYVKAGGTPWKLSGFENDAVYVGLSYCLRKGEKPQFVTCCSQMFDSHGANLRFLLYESTDGQYVGENPFLPRNDMRRVMSRTLDLYQQQRGRLPRRLVVHKTTNFTREEIEGCTDALGNIDDLELLTLTQHTPWQGMKLDAPSDRAAVKGVPSMYPLQRGTLMQLGVFDYLLWTSGNCSSLGKGSFFKEGKGIPHPIRVTRHVGSLGFREGAREILGLTKMNWNNDNLYDQMPVTNKYATVLAEIVKRMGSLSNKPYELRYFM